MDLFPDPVNELLAFEKQVFSEHRRLLISLAKNQRVATSIATAFLERLGRASRGWEEWRSGVVSGTT